MTPYRPEGASLRQTRTDTFGVPDNVFGHVPERFYGALGRVAALGALVEMRLGQVVMELERLTEAQIAGRPTGELVERIEKTRKARLEAGRPLPASLVALVGDAHAAMGRRNEVVHSLWPSPTLDAARGWRTVRPKKGSAGAQTIATVEVDEAWLLALIADLVRIACELRDVVSVTGALS